MERAKASGLNKRISRAALLSLLLPTAMAVLPQSSAPSTYVYAQSAGKVRTLDCEYITEENCPIQATAKCHVDLDPFDAPMSSKIYLDYRNNSDKPVSAVKFRVRFVDAEGKDRGTFHAVDSFYLQPGGERSQKWKRDFTLHPGVVGMKVRALQVKYSDGGGWQSVKMQELAGSSEPGAGAPTGGGGDPAAGGGEAAVSP